MFVVGIKTDSMANPYVGAGNELTMQVLGRNPPGQIQISEPK